MEEIDCEREGLVKIDLEVCYIGAIFVHMKTNPTGIRFEVEDLDFIKRREKLETPQQVVYFLLLNILFASPDEINSNQD